MTELADRVALVSASWRPESLLHVGDLAWAAARGDGSTAPTSGLVWGDPCLGFADVWLSGAVAEVTAYVSPAAADDLVAKAARELAGLASSVFLEVSRADSRWVAALRAHGFAEVGGPWFARLHRDLGDVTDLEAHEPPPGFTVRAVRADDPADVAARVALHRRCWAPARIRGLLGLPVTGDEPPSSYDQARHHAVRAAPGYRSELDVVVQAPDGALVAYALGWLDPGSASVLLEPVGTDPAYAGRGLARAVSASVLRGAAARGATRAVVAARGDDAYPVPRRVYEALGMREVTQQVTVGRRPARPGG